MEEFQWQTLAMTQEADADNIAVVIDWINECASFILLRATRDSNGALLMQTFCTVPVATFSSLKEGECLAPFSA